ncbi:MAG: hypothetical protein ACRCT8_15750 [Lacipirellulaceae bacterium]
MAVLVAALYGGANGPAHAFDVTWTAGTSSWTTGSNWTGSAVPEATFEEVAIITNGGTALLSAPAPNAAGLTLGLGSGQSGTLRVLSGGSIQFVASTGGTNGNARIGENGVGTLAVLPGGSLSATSLDVNPGSTLAFGGSGSPATLASTGNAFLGGSTTVTGGNHSLNVAATAFLEASGSYAVELPSTGATTLTAGSGVFLGGALTARSLGSFTPSLGASWRLFNAPSIGGAFSSVNVSAMPVPVAGATYRFGVESGGLGQVGDLTYEASATLVINTDTGIASLASPTGVPIQIIGYSVQSASGSLAPGQWTPLQNNPATPGWNVAGASSASVLSELNPLGSLTVNSTARSIGAVYSAPTTFGTSPVVTFEYAVAGETEGTPGLVQLTGSRAANNLLLTVDPTSGEARLQNSSAFAVSLVGYSVLSQSGALLPANGDWQSLSDSSFPGWQEAAPTATALSELRPGSGVTISPGQSFAVGQLFNPTGRRDLVLEFALAGELAPRSGAVSYAPVSISAGVQGDYNGDGAVNAADYTVWRDNVGGTGLPNEGGVSLGAVDQADYLFWRSRYGASTPAATSVAVPSPASSLLAWMGVAGLLASTVRRSELNPLPR